MRSAVRLVVVAVVVAAAALAAGALLDSAGSAQKPTRVVAGVLVRPMAGSGVQGAAFFRQDGARLSGWVTVWGLEPRTAHSVHFHGPNASCLKPGPAVAAHADLVADAKGVAFASFRTTSRLQVLRRGFYYNVHAGPTAAGTSADVSCGNIAPSVVGR